MSVHTSVFGGVTLTGKDAKKFDQQVTYGKPKKAARESVVRGNKMLAEYNDRGFVSILVKKKAAV